MSASTPLLLHASAVAINGEGVLFSGTSGSGKSDLALRLIDRGAVLISDDGVWVDAEGPLAILRTAPNIAGMIEMRGVGILKMPFADGVPLRLAVILDAKPERLPTPDTTKIAGHDVPCLKLSAFEASAPLKVEQAVRAATESQAA
ncbi:MAG: HPr kinase/phosphatase C-terminal domain-containing protein [Sphingorhabdus sp.]